LLLISILDAVVDSRWGMINGEIIDGARRCISCGGVGCIYVLHNMVVL